MQELRISGEEGRGSDLVHFIDRPYVRSPVVLRKMGRNRRGGRSFLPAAKPTGHRTVRVVVVLVVWEGTTLRS